jgi:hypothetical protein
MSESVKIHRLFSFCFLMTRQTNTLVTQHDTLLRNNTAIAEYNVVEKMSSKGAKKAYNTL